MARKEKKIEKVVTSSHGSSTSPPKRLMKFNGKACCYVLALDPLHGSKAPVCTLTDGHMAL